MDIEIRFAKEEDLDLLVSMWVDFMGGDFGISSNFKVTKSNIEKWKCMARISIVQKMVKVVEVSGKLAGFLLMNIGSPPFDTIYKCALILELYIIPEHRRKGYGTQLLRAGMNYLKILGYEIIALNVLSENEEALRFYEREGFERAFYTLKKRI